MTPQLPTRHGTAGNNTRHGMTQLWLWLLARMGARGSQREPEVLTAVHSPTRHGRCPARYDTEIGPTHVATRRGMILWDKGLGLRYLQLLGNIPKITIVKFFGLNQFSKSYFWNFWEPPQTLVLGFWNFRATFPKLPG